MVRGLLIGVGVLAVAYGGYWFAAARAAKSGAESLVASLRDDGVGVDYANLSVRGFPSRIDTTITDVTIVSADGAFTWSLPWFQVFALSYRPNRIIAAWPETQTLAVPGDVLSIGATDLMASADLGLAADLPLSRATLEGSLLAITTESGLSAGAAEMLAAFRHVESTDYDVYAAIGDLVLPEGIVAALDPGGRLPAAIGTIRLDGRATFDAPVAMGTSPRLTAFDLREARIDWGDAGLSLSGDLTAGPGGVAEGSLELYLRNWPVLIDMAVSADLIPADRAGLVRGALSAAAQGDVVLTLPLTLANGQMSFGILPLGPAPLLPFAQ